MDLAAQIRELSDEFNVEPICKQDMKLEYGRVFRKMLADEILEVICSVIGDMSSSSSVVVAHLSRALKSKYLIKDLERSIEYNDADMSRVYVFGKWHAIQRKHVSNDHYSSVNSNCAGSLRRSRNTLLVLKYHASSQSLDSYLRCSSRCR